MVVFGKVVVYGQSSCFLAKWLYLDKSGCIQVSLVVIGQKWLYSGKVVVFGQKWFYSDKSGFIRVKVVVFGRVAVFGQNGSPRAKLVVSG